MSVGNESRQQWAFQTITASDNLGATGDAAAVFTIFGPITVLRIGVLITTVMNGAATVKFDRRVLAGSDTGRGDGDVGVLTVPDTTAAGKIVYKDVVKDLDAGDEVVPEVTAAATSGGGRYFIEFINLHKVAADQADMVKSA